MDSSFGIGAIKDVLQGTLTLGGRSKADEAGAVQAAQGAQTQAEKQLDPMEAYVVELSEAAKKLAREGNPFAERIQKLVGGKSAGDDEEQDPVQRQMDNLQKQIERLQKEIDEIQGRAMDQEQKDQMLAAKRVELAQYQAQLAQLQQQRDKTLQQSLRSSSGGFYNTGSLT